MGCGASSGCKKDDRRKADRIDYSMEHCQIGEFDSMFKEVASLLQVMEETRAGLRETVDDIKEMCEVDRLTNPTFDDCIKAWMWSISSNNGGQFLKAGFNIVDEPPFFEVNCSGCSWEAWWIQEYLYKFIKTAFEMPGKVADALSNLGSLAEKVSNLDPAGAIESSSLDLFDKVKAAKAFGENAVKTAQGLKRAKDIGEIIVDAAKQIKSLVSNMKLWVAEVDVYGKLAFEKSLWRPYQIIRDVHPGPKKTPDQLKDFEEMVLNNKCGCPKCLKEAAEQAQKDVKK